MITNGSFIEGLVLHATDGEIGTVDDFLFDDESWAVRYLTVNTGGWLSGRQVLISPFSIREADWQGKRLDVSLTKSQVENSPNIDTHLPVSRQHEAEFLGYYGYPYYWAGPYLWGPAFYPMGGEMAAAALANVAEQHAGESPDSHLRSSDDISNYHIEATDGDIGHLDGFILDDEDWTIRYVEVATRNWLPGKKILLSTAWIDRISWDDSKVYAAVSKEAIQTAPEYIMSRPLTREYESRLYAHYGRPPYWLVASEKQSTHSLN